MWHRQTKIIVILNSILIITILLLVIIKNTQNAILTISVTPIDSIITINGKQYTNGTYKFHPGIIKVKIQHDDLDSQELSISLSSNQNNRLQTFLTKAGSFDYYMDNNDDYIQLRQISRAVDNSSLNDFLKTKQKIDELSNFFPIYYSDNTSIKNYKKLKFIFSTKDCKRDTYCIVINDQINGNYDFAINLLKKYGFTNKDYEIIYNSLCNEDVKTCLENY